MVSWVIAECPELSKTDEFGRKLYFVNCDAIHGDIEYDCDHKRLFDNKDSAIVFYNKAIKEEHNTVKQSITNLSFDVFGAEMDSINN